MKPPRSELSKSDEWATPPELFVYLARLYGPFDCDAAAAPWNAKAKLFYTKQRSGLSHVWGRRTWCNPPYSTGMKEAFSERGRTFVLDGTSELSCFLLPHDTADGYWTRVVEAAAGTYRGTTKQRTELGTVVQTQWAGLTVEKTEIRGRIQYLHKSGRAIHTARHSSAVVVFARPGLLAPLRGRSFEPFPGSCLERAA